MAILREYKPALEENGLMIMRETEKYRYENRKITGTATAAHIVGEVFGLKYEADENMVCVCMNAKGEIIGMFKNSSGSNNRVQFDVAGICKKALLLNAVSVILAHNHPGGTCAPSSDDINATKCVKAGLDILGINLLDHIIIPAFSNSYCSFVEDGYFSML